ncbi:hypothetical protein [Methanolobus sp. WCC5]|jgi:hypothetical protein|uniref:hypothetical protein n=1 Tax=Methanolobus sp. WCC5 TaxID=3125785 RepID=UPI00324B33E5
MSTLTVPVDDELYEKIQSMSWVRWSRVVQDGIRKRKIVETYIRDKNISEADAVFCELMDWHPVDELPFREDVLENIRKTDKRSFVKVQDISDIFR